MADNVKHNITKIIRTWKDNGEKEVFIQVIKYSAGW